MTEETSLIKRIAQGDKGAFEVIVNQYKNYIFAIILRFIKDPDQVENLAQEVFIQIYLSLPKYKDNNLKAWISRIATNKSIDYIRMLRAKPKETDLDLSEAEAYQSLDNRESPLELLLRKENEEDLRNLLNDLPEIYRDILIKFYVEEKTYKEIASEENLAEKTIESRLYRARKIAREKWRERL